MCIPSIGVRDEHAMVVVDDRLVAASCGVREGWEGEMQEGRGSPCCCTVLGVGASLKREEGGGHGSVSVRKFL